MSSSRLGYVLIAVPRMRRLNESFLRHAGPTDVITFNYSDAAPRIPHSGSPLHGEIFVCVDEAIVQARRFCTIWQAEIVRYVIHGVLHLLGHDDFGRQLARRRMKAVENQLLRKLARQFALERLQRSPHRS